MARGEPFIVLRLSTQEPIELSAFVGAFAALGDEYERYSAKWICTFVKSVPAVSKLI
jgi:hypothetical protein